MSFWIAFAAYEAVWFAAVIGAAHERNWPGVLACTLFGLWRMRVAARRDVEWRLALVALVLGIVLETAWSATDLVRYAAPWPDAAAPAWMLALWVAFGLSIVPLFGHLHARTWLAVALGAVGGPLAYLGAARGWHAVTMTTPAWHTLLALAIGWAIAMPLLTSLARRWLRVPRVERAA